MLWDAPEQLGCPRAPPNLGQSENRNANRQPNESTAAGSRFAVVGDPPLSLDIPRRRLGLSGGCVERVA